MQLYDPNRVPASLPGLMQLAEEAKTTIQSYGDIVLPKLPNSLDSVEPGSGAVMQVFYLSVIAMLSCFMSTTISSRASGTWSLTNGLQVA